MRGTVRYSRLARLGREQNQQQKRSSRAPLVDKAEDSADMVKNAKSTSRQTGAGCGAKLSFFLTTGGIMARITVEDCQARVNNRFLLVQMAIKRVHQYREGYPALLESRNKQVVTALREIAAAKIMPDDLTYYQVPDSPIDPSKID